MEKKESVENHKNIFDSNDFLTYSGGRNSKKTKAQKIIK